MTQNNGPYVRFKMAHLAVPTEHAPIKDRKAESSL